jgi:hypothetical protein
LDYPWDIKELSYWNCKHFLNSCESRFGATRSCPSAHALSFRAPWLGGWHQINELTLFTLAEENISFSFFIFFYDANGDFITGAVGTVDKLALYLVVEICRIWRWAVLRLCNECEWGPERRSGVLTCGGSVGSTQKRWFSVEHTISKCNTT